MNTKAKLSMTGRDIQDIELKLEFDKVNCLWKLVEHDVYEAFSDDETIISALWNYIRQCKKFYDTSTVLIGELKRIEFVEDITPATLSKKLRTHADLLHDKFHIKIDFIRKSDKRILSIYDSSDDNNSSIA